MRSHKDEFSKDTKAKAFARAKGHCECGCGMKIIAGDGPEYDHRIEVALGGDNSLENCVVLRKRCHRSKTSSHAGTLAKVKRTAEKNAGLRKPKGRPLPGTKASGWKKRFDGSTVRR